MIDVDQRRQAIDDLATALKDAERLTVELSADQLGLVLRWPDCHHPLTVRTKRIRYGDDWETWFVEPPGSKIAETRHVSAAAKLLRDLSGERVH
jgi:hypothetical protein